MNMIDTKPIWDNVVENTKISSYLTKKDIKDAGFISVNNPVITIDDKSYTCCRRKIVPTTEKDEFDKTYNKERVIQLIKEKGFTHIKSVDMHSFPYFFNLEFPAKNAVCIMLEGFTKKD